MIRIAYDVSPMSTASTHAVDPSIKYKQPSNEVVTRVRPFDFSSRLLKSTRRTGLITLPCVLYGKGRTNDPSFPLRTYIFPEIVGTTTSVNPSPLTSPMVGPYNINLIISSIIQYQQYSSEKVERTKVNLLARITINLVNANRKFKKERGIRVSQETPTHRSEQGRQRQWQLNCKAREKQKCQQATSYGNPYSAIFHPILGSPNTNQCIRPNRERISSQLQSCQIKEVKQQFTI